MTSPKVEVEIEGRWVVVIRQRHRPLDDLLGVMVEPLGIRLAARRASE